MQAIYPCKLSEIYIIDHFWEEGFGYIGKVEAYEMVNISEDGSRKCLQIITFNVYLLPEEMRKLKNKIFKF